MIAILCIAFLCSPQVYAHPVFVVLAVVFLIDALSSASNQI